MFLNFLSGYSVFLDKKVALKAIIDIKKKNESMLSKPQLKNSIASQYCE